MRGLVIGCAVLAMLASSASAHDFWLFPSAATANATDSIDVHVCYGTGAAVEELERRTSHIKRFELHTRAGSQTVPGEAGKVPAGQLALASAEDEIVTVVYESHHSSVVLEPRRFENYLAEEGLLDIISDRQRRSESELPGADSFARFAKTLIRIGSGSEGYDRKLGLLAELTATSDPFVGGTDGQLTFQFSYLDQPKAGARVDLFRLEANKITLVETATTDREGNVAFHTPGLGRWMIAATGMRRASYPVEGDWESSWASLSFEVVSMDGAAARRRIASKPALVAAIGIGVVVLGVFAWRKRRKSHPVGYSGDNPPTR